MIWTQAIKYYGYPAISLLGLTIGPNPKPEAIDTRHVDDPLVETVPPLTLM